MKGCRGKLIPLSKEGSEMPAEGKLLVDELSKSVRWAIAITNCMAQHRPQEIVPKIGGLKKPIRNLSHTLEGSDPPSWVSREGVGYRTKPMGLATTLIASLEAAATSSHGGMPLE